MTRRVGYLMGAVALVSAGAYLFIYLYRWEWHRALIVGLFFLIAEIALAAALILERLRRLEQRMGGRAPADDGVRGRIRESAPPPGDHFRWLTRDRDDLGVFIPVMIGAGVVLSGLAWLVERIARATAAPALERGLAARLAPLSLPAGGLIGGPEGEPAPPNGRGRHHVPVARVAVLVLVAVAVAVSIDRVADMTQNRPDPEPAGSHSRVLIEVSTRRGATAEQAVLDLWGACQDTVASRLEAPGVVEIGGGRFLLPLEPGLGKYGARRLKGCLEDATLDHIQGRVVELEPLEE